MSGMRRGLPLVRPAGAAVALVVLVAFGGRTARAAPPLQYRLEVGDCLVYEREAHVTAREGVRTGSRADRIAVWVLEQSGSEWLVLITSDPTVDGRPEPGLGAVLHVDAAGRRRVTDTVERDLLPLAPAFDVLPMLPLLNQGADGWVGGADACGRRDRCVAREPARGGVRPVEFASEDPPAVAEVLGIRRTGTFWFDPAAGVITSFESDEFESAAQKRTRVRGSLRQRAVKPATWAARRAAEAARYVRALRHEERLLHELLGQPDAATQTLDQLDRLWAGFQGDVEGRAESPFVALAEQRRQWLLLDRERLLTWALLAERWLGRPARSWTLQDATGSTVTSEAARRGVVVEGFWSARTRCGFRFVELLRSWPQVPGGRTVSVLCYNTDHEWDFARRAATAVRAPCLLAGNLAAAEALPETPVLRVLDASGVVRGIWIGLQPAYPEAVELVQRLARPP